MLGWLLLVVLLLDLLLLLQCGLDGDDNMMFVCELIHAYPPLLNGVVADYIAIQEPNPVHKSVVIVIIFDFILYSFPQKFRNFLPSNFLTFYQTILPTSSNPSQTQSLHHHSKSSSFTIQTFSNIFSYIVVSVATFIATLNVSGSSVGCSKGPQYQCDPLIPLREYIILVTSSWNGSGFRSRKTI